MHREPKRILQVCIQRIVVFYQKQNIPPTPQIAQFSNGKIRVWIIVNLPTPAETSTPAIHSIDLAILALAATDGPLLGKQIAGALAKKYHGNFRSRLSKLIAKGLLRHPQDGVGYEATEAGLALQKRCLV